MEIPGNSPVLAAFAPRFQSLAILAGFAEGEIAREARSIWEAVRQRRELRKTYDPLHKAAVIPFDRRSQAAKGVALFGEEL